MKLIVLKSNVPINEVEVEIPDLQERYEIYVGRADDCHVLIDDPLISRHHFVIKNEGTEWFAEKLTQLGVVLVNGQSALVSKLVGGDEIKCGIYSIIISDLPKVGVSAQLAAAPAPVANLAPLEEELYGPPKKAIPAPVPLASAQADLPNETPLEESALDATEELQSEDFPAVEGFGPLQDESPLNENRELGSEESTFEPEENKGEEGDFGNEASTSLEAFPDEGASGEGDSGGSDNESTRFFKAFVNYQLVLFGDHAPYDRFQLDLDEVFIGRDTKKCQIVLDDPEVSSVHAVLRKSGNDVTLEDLNSSNGTILNGERINKAHVNTGDDFIIGSTTITLEVKSDLLDAEAGRLMPVEAGQVIETEEIVEEEVNLSDGEELDFNTTEAVPEKSIIKRIMNDPKKKKMVYIVGGLIFAAIMLLPEEKDIPQEDKKKVTEEEKSAVKKDDPKKLQLSPDQIKRRNIAYELGVSYFEQGKYFEAQTEFDKVIAIDPEYKKIQSYSEQNKVAQQRIAELEAKKREEAERLEKKKKIEELVVKARDAVKERSVAKAEGFFGKITELDPENMEVPLMKAEIEAWQKEEEKKALEEAAKIAARKKMVDSLAPGKTSYLKKEWYRAVLKLEDFMRIKGMDEDLVKEGSEMLSDAKNQLASELGPLLGKARSLKEGQDFKNAYEAYLEVLKVDPTNAEALNEIDEIKSQLETRSRRIYREAIIAESLSLFGDAKEKFQEVQQISPTDSDYYRKASDKLKNYME
jgi:pSer/pThr/pTyr-binding forkhead associated (FHA) protein/tetratricopeptide (TPR) repeat protein